MSSRTSQPRTGLTPWQSRVPAHLAILHHHVADLQHSYGDRRHHVLAAISVNHIRKGKIDGIRPCLTCNTNARIAGSAAVAG
jgi:hypothetical protein